MIPRYFFALLAFLLTVASGSLLQAASPVQIRATVQKLPTPQITLHLTSVSSGYTIYRTSSIGNFKGSWGSSIATTTSPVWSDTDVVAGVPYEYRVVPTDAGADESYIMTGIELPRVEHRGRMILLVDDRFSKELVFELNRLERDLAGDGWTVVRRDVSANDMPSTIKTAITSIYYEDPANTVALFLFGHIPVAYSGWLDPDYHGKRPGPTDTYYADMDGIWSDHLINFTNPVDDGGYLNPPYFKNLPGDGKFDQTIIPSDLELQVGRVDFWDMPAFTSTGIREQELLRRYLNKDHDFRNKLFSVENRGAQMESETGGYNFQQMFGTTPYTTVPVDGWFPLFENNSYLWNFKGGGGGSYDGTYGIGNTDNFAASQGVKVVFNSWFASKYWEWDVTNAFLKAPLAAKGYSLVNFWSENPNWILHQMAMGNTIGAAALLSQNNDTYYNSKGYYIPPGWLMELNRRGIHLNLLGDPSLRMHVVAPPDNVRTSGSTSPVVVTWESSPETGLYGYDVYRSSSPAGPFTRLNAEFVSDNTFSDYSPVAGSRYMVKAVKLETSSGSGTYLNSSEGVLDSHGPAVLQVTTLADTSVTIVFDTAVDKASAESAGNYHINNGITVNSAILQPDMHTVILATSPHADGGHYLLTTQNIYDTRTPAGATNSDPATSYTHNIVPEYRVDSGTIALWHLNGNGDDAGGNGFNLTLRGNAGFTSPGFGKTGATRECLRVSRTRTVMEDGGFATVTIPDAMMLPNEGGVSLTIEAWIYVDAFAPVASPLAPMLSAYQEYDTYFMYAQDTWASPRGGKFTIGNPAGSPYVLIPDERVNTLIQPGRWNHIAMVMDGSTETHYVYINNSSQAIPVHSPVFWQRSNPWTIVFGNFDGYIDEVRISSVSRLNSISTGVSGSNGTIYCPVINDYNSNPTCTITSYPGFTLNTLTDNGIPVISEVAGSNYTIRNLNGSHTVIASFSATPMQNVKLLSGAAASYFQNISNAYLALSNTGHIQARDIFFTGDLTFDRPVSVTIDGGRNWDFRGNTGRTTIRGKVLVNQGVVTLNNLIVR